MALHAPLTQFLARLNTDLGVGTSNEFLGATGRRLVAAHVLPEEEFSRTGQPSDSDLGSLLRTLHSLGAAVDWGGAVTAGHASVILQCFPIDACVRRTRGHFDIFDTGSPATQCRILQVQRTAAIHASNLNTT